jgi:hypothetical protein
MKWYEKEIFNLINFDTHFYNFALMKVTKNYQEQKARVRLPNEWEGTEQDKNLYHDDPSFWLFTRVSFWLLI